MKVCFEASPLPLWGPKAAKIHSELSNVFPRVYKLPSELRCHLPQKPRSMRVLDPKHDPSTSTALRTKASIWFLCSFFSFCLLEAHGTPVGYSLLRQGGVTAMLKLAHTWEAPMASKNPLYKQEMRESCSLGERRSSAWEMSKQRTHLAPSRIQAFATPLLPENKSRMPGPSFNASCKLLYSSPNKNWLSWSIPKSSLQSCPFACLPCKTLLCARFSVASFLVSLAPVEENPSTGWAHPRALARREPSPVWPPPPLLEGST